MIIGTLGALLIAALILSGVLAMRDPEAGLTRQTWSTLIRAKSTLLPAAHAELFALLSEPLRRQHVLLFPKVTLGAIFEPGRLTPTGWHRMHHSVIDLVLADAETLQPIGLIVLSMPDSTINYLEEENRQMRESAIEEAGMPLLKIILEPDLQMCDVATDVLRWVGMRVQSEGSKTQVDLL